MLIDLTEGYDNEIEDNYSNKHMMLKHYRKLFDAISSLQEYCSYLVSYGFDARNLRCSLRV